MTIPASLELNCLEVDELGAAREYLRPGQRIFVSHLPRQSWDQSLTASARVRAAGFEPVPHVPVRLLEDARQLEDILRRASAAGVGELLLISGDYPQARGPYGDVLSVLESGLLTRCGFTRVSFAGHPEGHPSVSDAQIRQAQIDKAGRAASLGLEVTFVSQFFFDVAPFIAWARDLREAFVDARIVAGLPGPARVGKLLKLARHCGVGPSLRALTARPASAWELLGRSPADVLLAALKGAQQQHPGLFDAIHVFSFGGFEHTARWLRDCARHPHPWSPTS